MAKNIFRLTTNLIWIENDDDDTATTVGNMQMMGKSMEIGVEMKII